MAHKHQDTAVGKQVLAGTMATATVSAGGKLMSKAAKHPVLVFGLGIVAGYLVYKYRKEIIASASKTVDAGKDFILHQKESLEDIVAESTEDK